MLYKRTTSYDYAMWEGEIPPEGTDVFYVGTGHNKLKGSDKLSSFLPINDAYVNHRNFNVVEGIKKSFYWYYIESTIDAETLECTNIQEIVDLFYRESVVC